MKCNKDCFNCKYDDCILTEEEAGKLDPKKYKMSEEARAKWREYFRKYHREWRKAHKEYERERHRRYYLQHREEILEKAKIYREAKYDKQRQA